MSQPHERVSLGLLTYSLALAQANHAKVPGTPELSDPAVFLDEAAKLGANAVQIPFGIRGEEDVRRIRDKAASLRIILESTLAVPREDSEIPKFEAELRTLKELGVKVTRTVLFPGRRYENFKDLRSFRDATAAAIRMLERSEPLARRAGVKLAVENHKDQEAEERVKLLEKFSSEYIGACVDTGNNLALLEDPVEVCRVLAPWALTVHFKDQAVREYEYGFLLADVPLGKGCIDLPAVIQVLRAKNPAIHFQLELITRDALKVPIFTDVYWATFPGMHASKLAAAWKRIREHGAAEAFPVISKLSPADKIAAERKNIEESFACAAARLDLRA